MIGVRIWRFSDPRDDRFAATGRRDAWVGGAPDGVCPSCTASRQVRAQPLVMAWEPGSDRIGDFTWPGFGSEVVVTDGALGALSRFEGFEPGPLEVVEDPDGPKGGHAGSAALRRPFTP